MHCFPCLALQCHRRAAAAGAGGYALGGIPSADGGAATARILASLQRWRGAFPQLPAAHGLRTQLCQRADVGAAGTAAGSGSDEGVYGVLLLAQRVWESEGGRQLFRERAKALFIQLLSHSHHLLALLLAAWRRLQLCHTCPASQSFVLAAMRCPLVLLALQGGPGWKQHVRLDHLEPAADIFSQSSLAVAALLADARAVPLLLRAAQGLEAEAQASLIFFCFLSFNKWGAGVSALPQRRPAPL